MDRAGERDRQANRWLNKAPEWEHPFSWLYRAIFYASRNVTFATLDRGGRWRSLVDVQLVGAVLQLILNHFKRE